MHWPRLFVGLSWNFPSKHCQVPGTYVCREKLYFPVHVRAREFGLAGWVRQSRPASSYSPPYSSWIWCLLTGFLPCSAAASIYLLKTAIYAIGSAPSLSGHVIAYRWRSLPKVRRRRDSKPQDSSERVLPWAGHHGPINIRLSFSHPLLV